MHVRSGGSVPAGALVEGVIAGASPSSQQAAGRLVIEIRALHVGNQTIPLHALPYVPSPLFSRNLAGSDGEAGTAGVQGLGVRNQLRPYPEAVMPKESVIEFQLVDADSCVDPAGHLRSPDVGVPSQLAPRKLEPDLSPLKPPLPDSSPSPRLQRARVAVARG
ncbi:MAG: hypothetical protein LC114_00615 [Bryobacterales bacterium]|nr:hypothetical protein [Bryobacterales bacterium]